jgi:hypothetical protein
MEDIFLPVVEGSMIVASHYCKATGRSTVTAKDVEYGMKFAIRNILGNQIGSFFPEIYDEEESDEDDIEVVDDQDEPFSRYEGDDPVYLKVNDAVDTWDSWEPFSPAEIIMKNALQNGWVHQEGTSSF